MRDVAEGNDLVTKPSMKDKSLESNKADDIPLKKDGTLKFCSVYSTVNNGRWSCLLRKNSATGSCSCGLVMLNLTWFTPTASNPDKVSTSGRK